MVASSGDNGKTKETKIGITGIPGEENKTKEQRNVERYNRRNFPWQ